jgi:SagB-type dehydrogenase family enzyme
MNDKVTLNQVVTPAHEANSVRLENSVLSNKGKFNRIVIFSSAGLYDMSALLVDFLKQANCAVIALPKDCDRTSASKLIGSNRVLIVAPSFEREATSHYSLLTDMVAGNTTVWLRAVIGDTCEEFHVGPLLSSKMSPCYSCALLRLPEIGRQCGSLGPTESGNAIRIFMAWIAEEARLYFNEPLLAPGQFTIMNLRTKQSRTGMIIRDRRCASCGIKTGLDDDRTPYQKGIETLQDYFTFATRTNAPILERDHNNSCVPRFSPLATYARERVVLPYYQCSVQCKAHRRLRNILGRNGEDLSLFELANLLRLTAGARASGSPGGRGRRWCPSAGNKGSVFLSIHVQGASALRDGSYCYNSSDHSLEPDSSQLATLRELNLWPQSKTNLSSRAHMVLTVGGDCERLFPKYGMFAATLVYLDIGVATAQLLLQADQLHLFASLGVCPDTRVDHCERGLYADRLGAAIILSRKSLRFVGSRVKMSPSLHVSKSSDHKIDMTNPREVERLILECESEFATDSRFDMKFKPDALVVDLRKSRARALGGRPFRDVVERRQSSRSFTATAPNREQIVTILTRALSSFRKYVDKDLRCRIRLVLVAERVSGLTCGQYSCDFSFGRLTVKLKMKAKPQVNGNGPAFTCMILGNSNERSVGKFLTYGQQHVLAGLLGQFLCLEATAENLAGCLVARGRLIHSYARQMEAKEDLVLFAFVGGYAARGEVDSGFEPIS